MMWKRSFEADGWKALDLGASSISLAPLSSGKAPATLLRAEAGGNMQVIIGVFISFAAALLFFLVEPMLLGLSETWRTIAAVIVFVVVIGITFYLHWRTSGSSKEPRSIAMRNKSKKDLDIEMKNVKAKDGSGNIASENESGGNTKIKISDSDL
ncbi:hypothetical protein P1J78_00265 [Psychromarinibacter sp. C21-152]|uniref:Uncharacterized protein n=2 Tax=Psychromarinibacter sediminicola TaxID=3033385 RepID=A0AAE3NMU4_9RHOB|nr:hypothetical protein [Psychromarinibacter sediminicola]